MSRTGLSPHDELELRVAEALCGEAPLDEALRAHVRACASCGVLAGALHALADDARSSDPDDAYWRGFDERLRARLPGLPPVPLRRPDRRRPLVVGLGIAAAVAAVALALWTLRPVSPGGDAEGDEQVAGAALDPAAAPQVLAAAGAESLELGLQSLGLGDGWEDDAADAGDVLPDAAVAAVTGAPAWGDAVGEMAEELAPLDAAEQEALARALREAT